MICIVKRREGSELELVLGGLEKGEDDEAVRCRASCARHDARAYAA